LAFTVTGTVNRTSSGRPASAVDRSRTAIRSVAMTVTVILRFAVIPLTSKPFGPRPGRLAG